LFFFPLHRLSHVEKKILVRLKGEVRLKREKNFNTLTSKSRAGKIFQ
jgi:hypothetical protein